MRLSARQCEKTQAAALCLLNTGRLQTVRRPVNIARSIPMEKQLALVPAYKYAQKMLVADDSTSASRILLGLPIL